MQAGVQRGLAGVRYVVDKDLSRFTVQAFATGLFSAFAHNPRIAIRDYEGDINFVPGTYEKAFVRLSVLTASLEPLDELKKEDREKLQRIMETDVLQIERFPRTDYESRQIDVQKLGDDLLLAKVSGALTLCGVTRPHGFDARVQSVGTTLRISGVFGLRQSDYDIKMISLAGGTLRLKDELKFNFELLATKVD